MTKKFFRRYSWFLVGYNVLVILWGAVVRATGSGAGCGAHWPLCNGEVVPQPQYLETVIELVHRITTTLDGFLVILLVVFAYRLYGKKDNIFRWAVAALVFIIIEGLLGRMLVVREWVADDMSVARAIVVAIHLLNTYILLLTMTYTAWLANLKEVRLPRQDKLANRLLLVGIISVMIFSAMGAVTALGDTLFPADSLIADVAKDFDPASHFLLRLRVIHPILAILTSGYLFFVVRHIQNRGLGARVNKYGNWLLIVMAVQVLAGGFTILLLAPLAMQVIHLLLADIFLDISAGLCRRGLYNTPAACWVIVYWAIPRSRPTLVFDPTGGPSLPLSKGKGG